MRRYYGNPDRMHRLSIPDDSIIEADRETCEAAEDHLTNIDKALDAAGDSLALLAQIASSQLPGFSPGDHDAHRAHIEARLLTSTWDSAAVLYVAVSLYGVRESLRKLSGLGRKRPMVVGHDLNLLFVKIFEDFEKQIPGVRDIRDSAAHPFDLGIDAEGFRANRTSGKTIPLEGFSGTGAVMAKNVQSDGKIVWTKSKSFAVFEPVGAVTTTRQLIADLDAGIAPVAETVAKLRRQRAERMHAEHRRRTKPEN